MSSWILYYRLSHKRLDINAALRVSSDTKSYQILIRKGDILMHMLTSKPCIKLQLVMIQASRAVDQGNLVGNK